MKQICLAILFSTLFASCGGYNEGIIQKSEKGFIQFTGNLTQIVIQIDNGEPFNYDIKNPVYQVKPGKHTVQVFRNDEELVNRIVFIDNQTTMEIDVP